MTRVRKYQRGDPDPTPNTLSGSMKCPARICLPHPNGGMYWLECTWRDDAHDPELHVAAGMDGKILHVWEV